MKIWRNIGKTFHFELNLSCRTLCGRRGISDVRQRQMRGRVLILVVGESFNANLRLLFRFWQPQPTHSNSCEVKIWGLIWFDSPKFVTFVDSYVRNSPKVFKIVFVIFLIFKLESLWRPLILPQNLKCFGVKRGLCSWFSFWKLVNFLSISLNLYGRLDRKQLICFCLPQII